MMAARGRQIERAEAINLDRCYAESDRQIAVSRRTQALLAGAGMDGPTRFWFVLRVVPNREKAVDKVLEAAAIERWVPVVEVVPPRRGGRRNGARVVYEKVAFPGYIFVKTAATARAWAGIATIRGVLSVLGGAYGPVRIPDDNILKLQAFLEKDPDAVAVLTRAIRKGDKVRVTNGPLASFPGIVQEVRAHGRALVEVLIFGRVTPVDLELARIAKSD